MRFLGTFRRDSRRGGCVLEFRRLSWTRRVRLGPARPHHPTQQGFLTLDERHESSVPARHRQKMKLRTVFEFRGAHEAITERYRSPRSHIGRRENPRCGSMGFIMAPWTPLSLCCGLVGPSKFKSSSELHLFPVPRWYKALVPFIRS